MYAGALGDNAVERYALFLTSLALSADPAERRTALQRAREHGLDVPRVAIVTAERTIERALASLPSAVKGQLPNLAKAVQEPAEEAEMLLVRSIEWTVVESETYDTALEQTNVILKYVLGARISPSSFRRKWRILSRVAKSSREGRRFPLALGYAAPRTSGDQFT